MGYYLRNKYYPVRLIALIICFGLILSSLSTVSFVTFPSVYARANTVLELDTTIDQALADLPQGRIPGLIDSSTNLTLPNSPYYIESNITITNTGSLNIEPGTEIFVNGSYYIFVNGILNASGKEDQFITFTSNFTALPNPGDWGGIQFNSTATGNIDYCYINYSTMAIYTNSNTNLTFSNNSISYALAIGISVLDSNITLVNTTISNGQKDGIVINGSNQSALTGNVIHNIKGNAMNLTNCNESALTGNIIYFTTRAININDSVDVSIINNVLYNNSYGIYIMNSTNSEIKHNIIYNTTICGITLFGPGNSGFDLINNSVRDSLASGIEINQATDGNLFENTITSIPGTGLQLQKTQDLQIEDCEISNCSTGLDSLACDNDLIKNCHIHNNTAGIHVDASVQLYFLNIDCFIILQ